MNLADRPTVRGIDPGLDGGLYSSNVGWPARTLKAKGGESRALAMMANLADRVWTLAEWIERPAVRLA